jgi:hypothetical protein
MPRYGMRGPGGRTVRVTRRHQSSSGASSPEDDIPIELGVMWLVVFTGLTVWNPLDVEPVIYALIALPLSIPFGGVVWVVRHWHDV